MNIAILTSSIISAESTPELDKALLMAYDFAAYRWHTPFDSTALYRAVQDRIEDFSDTETAMDLLVRLAPDVADKGYVDVPKLITLGDSMNPQELVHLVALLASVPSDAGITFLEKLSRHENRELAREAKQALNRNL